MGLQEDGGIEAALRLHPGQQTLTPEQDSGVPDASPSSVSATSSTPSLVHEGPAQKPCCGDAYAAAGLLAAAAHPLAEWSPGTDRGCGAQ